MVKGQLLFATAVIGGCALYPLEELIRIFCDCKPPDPARCELEFKLLDAIFLP